MAVMDYESQRGLCSQLQRSVATLEQERREEKDRAQVRFLSVVSVSSYLASYLLALITLNRRKTNKPGGRNWKRRSKRRMQLSLAYEAREITSSIAWSRRRHHFRASR